MLVMKNYFFYNFSKYFNRKKLKKLNKNKNLLFNLIKNYYLIIESHKNLILVSPEHNINTYFSTIVPLTSILHQKVDK